MYKMTFLEWLKWAMKHRVCGNSRAKKFARDVALSIKTFPNTNNFWEILDFFKVNRYSEKTIDSFLVAWKAYVHWCISQ